MSAISKRINLIEHRHRRRNRNRGADGTTATERILARLAAIRARLEAGQAAVPGSDVQVSMETIIGAETAMMNDTIFPRGLDVAALKAALYADVEFMQRSK